MSARMWQPQRGLLPIPEVPGSPHIPKDVLLEAATQLGHHFHIPSAGSQEHLDELLAELHGLCDDILTHGPRYLDSPNLKGAFETIISDCLELLDSPDSVQDPVARTKFFRSVRGIAIKLMAVIQKNQDLTHLMRRLPEFTNKALRKSSRYINDLPRWTQFLGFNAPGAKRLQVQLEAHSGFLQPQRRGYQILPQAGIRILRVWDESMKCSINNMDPTWLKGYWAPRFEWGSLSQHRLALGIRRFDSVCMKPSPWAKPPRHKNAHQLAFVNNHRTELEHLNSFLGDAAVGSGHMPGVFGGNLDGICYTRRMAQHGESSENFFDFVLVQRFIRDDELERLRERDSLSLEEYRRLLTTGPSASTLIVFPNGQAVVMPISQCAMVNGTWVPRPTLMQAPASQASSSAQTAP
ncbi:hypothetical protein MPH_11059 [Macrophomina phaseolina MS6]|uniref:Uncharacterized protein n=1 Tax=Macrophomina phaseolina (strain MS6) TaxID=1126212 RepID=K2QNT9_MACPH|nr:hypothetical protein MPH_11059 [Macrophomina phaseolina MS6]